MKPKTSSAFGDIVAQLTALTAKLKAAATDDERRMLLRQYRTLLEQADQAALE